MLLSIVAALRSRQEYSFNNSLLKNKKIMATSKKAAPKKVVDKKLAPTRNAPKRKLSLRNDWEEPVKKTEGITDEEWILFRKAFRDAVLDIPKGFADLGTPNLNSINATGTLKVNAADNQDLPGGSSLYGHLVESDEAIDRILQSLHTLAKINAGMRGAEPAGDDVVRKGHLGLIGRAAQVKDGILLIDKYLQHQVNELQSALG